MDYAAAIDVFFSEAPPGVIEPEAVTRAAPARALRDALEPIAMHAVWSASVNAALAAHGHDFLTGYVTGRAAPLGEVPSSVVAATFAVFEPGLVDGLWSGGRALLPLSELIELRDAATDESLRAALNGVDEAEVGRVADVLEAAVGAADGTGRVLFAALRAQPRLADPYGRLWRAADLVREHRGDGHIAAYVAAGLDPVRMNVLTEVWLGYPVGEYSGTRAWPQDVADAAVARLEADGLLADGALTPAGRTLRNDIETATDASQQTLVDAIDSELPGLTSTLATWSQSCVASGSFPPDPRKRAAG